MITYYVTRLSLPSFNYLHKYMYVRFISTFNGIVSYNRQACLVISFHSLTNGNNCHVQNGLTALHLCAQEDFIKVASILVKNGANVESKTETGYRPIHVAAHFGNLSMIRFLLKHNATIDVKTNQNYTPLHQAAQQGHAHIVSALLEGNASHKARTNVST